MRAITEESKESTEKRRRQVLKALIRISKRERTEEKRACRRLESPFGLFWGLRFELYDIELDCRRAVGSIWLGSESSGSNSISLSWRFIFVCLAKGFLG